MHIVIIAWFFVAVMLAISAESLVAGVLSFFMWGIVPIGLLWYLFGRRKKRNPGN